MLWVLICTVHLTVCFYHVTYTFRVNPHSIVAWMSRNSLLEADVRSEQGVSWHPGNVWFTLRMCRMCIHSECARDMIKTCSQMHRTDKYSQHSSIIRPVWPNGWEFIYALSGRGFESKCSHLNFRFRACFEQEVPWHSGNYIVWIHSKGVRDIIKT